MDINVTETRLRSHSGHLLVYDWNWFDGDYITSPHLAKLMEAKNQLLGRQFPAAGIILYTDYLDDSTQAEQSLQAFMQDMLPAIEQALASAASNGT